MIAAGARPPFIQVGMLLRLDHQATEWRVRDIYEEEAEPNRSIADLVTRDGATQSIACSKLREHWLLATAFDEHRCHSGDWPRRARSC